MANIIIDTDKLEEFLNHATAVREPPNGDELAYGREVAKTPNERVIHAYLRKAFLTGQVKAWNEALNHM